jgi:hypothetical protein
MSALVMLPSQKGHGSDLPRCFWSSGHLHFLPDPQAVLGRHDDAGDGHAGRGGQFAHLALHKERDPDVAAQVLDLQSPCRKQVWNRKKLQNRAAALASTHRWVLRTEQFSAAYPLTPQSGMSSIARTSRMRERAAAHLPRFVIDDVNPRVGAAPVALTVPNLRATGATYLGAA